CEELWARAVFELENMRSTPAFEALYEQVCRGELTREQWIRRNTMLEYEAGKRTAEVYRKIWKPMREARGEPTSGSDWMEDSPATYEEWIAGYSNPDGYPWSFWGRYYDEEVEPYLRAINKRSE